MGNSRKHKAFVPPRAQGSSSGPQPRWSSKAEPTPGASSLVAYGGTSNYKTPSSAGTSKQAKQATSSVSKKPDTKQSSSSFAQKPERKQSSSSVSKKPDPFPIEKRKLPNGEVEYAPKGNGLKLSNQGLIRLKRNPKAKKNGTDKSFTKSKPRFNID